MARLIIMTGTLALLMGLMLFGLGIGERIHAGANLDGDPQLFAPAPAPDGHDPSGNPSIIRTRYVFPNFGLLSPDTTEDTPDLVQLNLFDDTSYVAQRHHVAGRRAGNFTWHGTIQDVENSRVTLVVRNDQVMVGNIILPDGIYQVRYVGDEVHAIYQIDERALPPHRDPIPVGSPDEEEANSTSLATAETYDDGSIIDVMVVYTAAARVAEGGTLGMEAMIDLAVEETNTAFANSLIYPRLRLVHAAEVSYVEAGNMGTDLSRLRGKTDGYMDEVHNWRDTYAADQVTLIEVSADYCGYAYVMTNVSSGFESAAFAVVHRPCATGYYTFGHELGHNVGSHHDRDNAGYSAAYSYSYGYQADNSFRTIMAYSSGCASPCPKFQGFSNPDVMFNGQPTGIDHDTDPANSADNARSINNTAYTVANFRFSGEAPINPPAAPSDLTATAVSDTQIDLGWTDNANNEGGFEVERSLDGTSWQLVGTVGTNATSYSANGLESSTFYYFRVRSYNGLGGSSYSNSATATTQDPPPYVEEMAYTEIQIAGTVTGSYPDTWSNDGGRERITERSSGGKPSKRHSYLLHKWVFDVRGGNIVTFSVDAYRSSTADGDDFMLAYSTDDSTYTDMLTVTKTSDDNTYQSYVLPNTTKGLVYIQASDTDQTQGNQSLDSLYVDHMFISSETYPGDPPAAPSNLSEVAVAPTAVDLAWVDNSFDESGFEIERSLDGTSWSVIGMAETDTTAYMDPGVVPSTSYYYRTRAFNGSGSSAYSNEVQVLTPGGITLAATGYKVKGVHHVDLDWSGAGSTNVDIYRDESMLVLINSDSNNDGSHTDNIGNKGGGTYNYYVCEQGSSTQCSNTVAVTF